eukprot:UN02611
MSFFVRELFRILVLEMMNLCHWEVFSATICSISVCKMDETLLIKRKLLNKGIQKDSVNSTSKKLTKLPKSS